MKIIKGILRFIFELSALVYPYGIFLYFINASDKITILSVIGMIIYSIIAINLFEWVFEAKNEN